MRLLLLEVHAKTFPIPAVKEFPKTFFTICLHITTTVKNAVSSVP